ncbi:pseudo-response regulator 5 [Raphanus sativus]|uniref:Two-component response regulator-like APRR5 n=1 Tax=Raphanus sativus TaxID=3726 RepID=A0A6J0NJZ7_RAPSA|nr:two-component response regulator-like APRR5 [Raphanus sativus]KAJ4900488.1 pseudo-response regulator 5 [Raphanus sativus]
MGEVSDEVVEVTVVEKAPEAAGGGKLTRRKMRRKDAAEVGDGLVTWERFLPKISLRVLLVEADDSTRQIISALLRKCSYRVAAVPDGLKAWEMLRGKPESVDLILTEVDLPSISGYALLTLIMEHDLCKNIPVIMMSTQDSVNTVYKCMLKGAADYLVKPLRRNELRNLWQHVWRRQSSLAPGSNFPVDEGVGQQKPEGASANNSTSNHVNGFQREERPVIGNGGGDDQSSCSRPEMQGESADVEDIPRVSSKEAIDFMGASFRRNGQSNREESVAKNDYSRIELDLSLRRPDACENQPSLHPSSASAFTRYVHRPLQTQCSVSPLVTDQRKNVDNNIVLINQYNVSEPPQSAQRRNEASFYNSSDSPGPPFSNQMNSWPGQGSYPTPVPIIQFPGPNTAHASAMAPTSVSPSPSSVSPHEYSSMFHPFNGKPEGLQERDGSMDIEERRHVSSATEHSGTGNQCSYIEYHHQQQPLLEKRNEEGYSSSVGKLQQSLQREAALNKFRMKRKERCFEKKVRYESRKKLAEQRPRIKGQFVRQVQSTETSTQEEVPQ